MCSHTLNPTVASSFYGYVTSLASSNVTLKQRMDDYQKTPVCNGKCHISQEAEAVACTELPDAALSPDFIAFCNTYLPHRAELL
jgi:hypothetical protein